MECQEDILMNMQLTSVFCNIPLKALLYISVLAILAKTKVRKELKIMLGIITLFVALSAQIALLVYQMVTKNHQQKVKNIMRLTTFGLFTLLLSVNVYWWGFRWTGLFILLLVLALISIISLIRKKQTVREFKPAKAILICINICILLTFSILPGIIFPQFNPIEVTGEYDVQTASVTLTDEDRTESYSEESEKRKITIQFWYPNLKDNDEKLPLIIFSHGSFGYRGSNLSTFLELASNGYVVCSIDHSYHAFFAKHMDKTMTIVDVNFLNDAVSVTNNEYEAEYTYNLLHEWLDLRKADMSFVLNEITNNESGKIPDNIYSIIDNERIGLTGHSLGGATAASLGRELDIVDAVIVIDGTMIGEGIDFKDNEEVLDLNAYPVPLLNLYNEDHYTDAMSQGTKYNNISASTNAVEAYDVVIRKSGHLNFTDLPMFSPALANLLGTGEVDNRYCIETMNQLVLDFFNYTLKKQGELNIKTEY